MTGSRRSSDVAARWQHRFPGLRSLIDSRIPDRFRSVLSAEDVLQEAWVTIARGVPDHVRDEDAWITRVVENRLLDALRAHRAFRRGGAFRRLRGSLAFSHGANLYSLPRTPSRDVRRQDRVLALHSAIGRLSPSTARLVRWRYFDELPLEVIERRSGRTKSAVRSALYRAFQFLGRSVRPFGGPFG